MIGARLMRHMNAYYYGMHVCVCVCICALCYDSVHLLPFEYICLCFCMRIRHSLNADFNRILCVLCSLTGQRYDITIFHGLLGAYIYIYVPIVGVTVCVRVCCVHVSVCMSAMHVPF